MKRILTIAVFALFATQLDAQKLSITEVPEAVLSAFKKANPTVANPEWKKDKSGYQVRYLVDKRQRVVTYTNSGTMVVHDSKVAIATLPPNVKVYLDKNYPSHADNVEKVLKMTKPDGTVNYVVNISGTDLTFDAKGNYLKTAKK